MKPVISQRLPPSNTFGSGTCADTGEAPSSRLLSFLRAKSRTDETRHLLSSREIAVNGSTMTPKGVVLTMSDRRYGVERCTERGVGRSEPVAWGRQAGRSHRIWPEAVSLP